MADKRKKAAKSAARAAEKAARKNPKLFLALVALVLVAAIVAAACWYFLIYKKKPAEPGGIGTTQTGELGIHFLDVGHSNTGDSIFIQYGNTEILIDAGSVQSSSAAIASYIDGYCKDGVLEYVIATHADQDHIAGFVGTKTSPGIFARYECKTIIDFPRTNKSLTTEKGNATLYGEYVAARDAEVEEGASHFTALQCYREEEGAKRSYVLDDAGNVTMNILYNKFYETNSSDENEYSVCMLLTQGEYNYLFTGDLESAGEKALAELNDLPHCKLYKAGHHGSPTSSSEELLAKIMPENVCVCCCAGSTQYTSANGNTFPSQEMIDHVARYTKNIYVTQLSDQTAPAKYVPFNGTIVVRSDGVSFSVQGTNHSTILPETDWFKQNRTWPSYGVPLTA